MIINVLIYLFILVLNSLECHTKHQLNTLEDSVNAAETCQKQHVELKML